MHTEIMDCGYSYHSQPFQTGFPEGLKTYLFRFQTEGCCEALVDGRMQRIEAGDLLLFKPGDNYDLNVTEMQTKLNSPETSISSGDYYVLCSGQWLDEWWGRKERPGLLRSYPMIVGYRFGKRSSWRSGAFRRRIRSWPITCSAPSVSVLTAQSKHNPCFRENLSSQPG